MGRLISVFAFLEKIQNVGRKFRRNHSIITVKEIEANLCFSIFGKNPKIQNGRHFGGEEFFFFFLIIANIALLRYPVGRKFR